MVPTPATCARAAPPQQRVEQRGEDCCDAARMAADGLEVEVMPGHAPGHERDLVDADQARARRAQQASPQAHA